MYYIDSNLHAPVFCFDEIFNSIPVDDIKMTARCNHSDPKAEYENTLKMNKTDGQFLLDKYADRIIELSKHAAYWEKRARNDIKSPSLVPLLLEGFTYQDLILAFLKEPTHDRKTLQQTYNKLISNCTLIASAKLKSVQKET
jgi:hypothetical protein